MHDAYSNAAAAGLLDALALVPGEPDEDPQAVISNDATQTTARGRTRPLLGLVDGSGVTSHIGR